MPFEGVLEGVFQVGGQGLSGPGDCCCYLVDAGEGTAVLIDAGLGGEPDLLFRNIEETGHRVRDVVALVLTHCHIDHIGGAPGIVDASMCEVVAHVDDRAAIEGGDAVRTAADAYGVPSPQLEVTRPISSDGGPLDLGSCHLTMVHTPGHTPGDISPMLMRGGRTVIFANDVHGPFRSAWGSDIRAWRRSMDRLIALAPDVLCEGHYGVLQPRGSALGFIREMMAQDVAVH